MTPYYEQDGITIYHGNSRDVLPSVAADVLITDSPYGINIGKEGNDHRLAIEKYANYEDTPENYLSCVVPIIAMALARVARGAVFAPFVQLTHLPQPAAVAAIYNKAGAGRSQWGWTQLHLVFLYGTNPHLAKGCYPTVFENYNNTEKNGHPCPKPIQWMRWLVDLASLSGETVLDCFAGSGTTLVAAKELGRKAVGIELEERYCEIAAKRLAQTSFMFQLLTPPSVEQLNIIEIDEDGHARRR